MSQVIKPATEMTTGELVAFLTTANEAYRSGQPLITDATYDQVYLAELRLREADHPFLNTVEPEADNTESPVKKVRHATPMLSTDKAYTQEEVTAFVTRVVKFANKLGIDESALQFRITPKLDGMAANYRDGLLVTRGNGLLGNDISRNLARGLVTVGGENTGVGEIVISNAYFNENLSDQFSHPRNFVTGLIGADTLSKEAVEAMQDKVIRFVPYSQLNFEQCDTEALRNNVEALCAKVEKDCEYPVDGSVIDVLNPELREVMGSTNHHHNWQIAKKLKGETALTTVEGITWQTGRTGRITPVLNVKTINLSGADISNVTGHNAGNIKNLNVGIGAEIEIVRSGEVIPKLLAVIREGEDAVIPEKCPACDAPAAMERDFLVCQGDACVAQLEARLLHFFSVLGNVDLFGPRTIAVLVENNICELPLIYQQQAADFERMGFGAKQASNLVAQLERSRSEAVEDWRFLAAFGIDHLGRGDSRKLLRVHKLETLHSLTSEQLIEIPGFGEITADAIPRSIEQRWPVIEAMLKLGFKLISDEPVAAIDSPISGKYIVFTGSMQRPRPEMQEQARQLGANVQTSVNKKTEILVIGEKVGAKKIEKAEALGTQVMTEADYLALIGN
ncbi:MAG: DNA ligase [Proteobacteria bacterium]|nr:MAG: DNA ligase [Pseudomonadota bacterium]